MSANAAKKKLRGPKAYAVNNPRNSITTLRLMDLDWNNWWTDHSMKVCYLHVKHKPNKSEWDGTVHRVYCRHSDRPRIMMKNGKLYWLVDEKETK